MIWFGRKRYDRARLFILLVIAISIVAVTGCDDPNWVLSPYYKYTVNVKGLDSYSSENGTAHIMMPVPWYNNSPVIPFDDPLAGNQTHYSKDISNSGGWDPGNLVGLNYNGYNGTRSLGLTRTPEGLMLDIETGMTGSYSKVAYDSISPSANVTYIGNNTYLVNKTRPSFDDVYINLRNILGPIGAAKTNDAVQSLRTRPLYPDAGTVDTPYTVWVDGANNSSLSYNSYIYIDPALNMSGLGQNLEVFAFIEVVTDEHPYGSIRGEDDVYVIKESIPSNARGLIPVKVQYAGRYSGAWEFENLVSENRV